MCNSQPTCTGVVRTKFGSYITKGGVAYETKNGGDSVFLCKTEMPICTKFALQYGSSDEERCLGGNALRRGFEYFYDHWQCDCESKCCKVAVPVDPTLPKIMTILLVNINMTNIHPKYDSLKDVENLVCKWGSVNVAGQGHRNSSSIRCITRPGAFYSMGCCAYLFLSHLARSNFNLCSCISVCSRCKGGKGIRQPVSGHTC